MENNVIQNEVVEQSTGKKILGGIKNFISKPIVKVGLILTGIFGTIAIVKAVKGNNSEDETDEDFDDQTEDEDDNDSDEE